MLAIQIGLDEREREEYKDLMVKDDKELDTLIREATSTGRPLSQGKKAGVNEIWGSGHLFSRNMFSINLPLQ
ncbi:hypothetical protein [Candidatus Kuenenia stuttgartiensis]|uniref:hypothetical protein n=1 Tax=Kuenenia stuttgartiensis TaxID=174633 RepID=UPI001469A2A3|nr:hypothetical protein [Candidatus Kuenenia stuttgartiensis]